MTHSLQILIPCSFAGWWDGSLAVKLSSSWGDCRVRSGGWACIGHKRRPTDGSRRLVMKPRWGQHLQTMSAVSTLWQKLLVPFSIERNKQVTVTDMNCYIMILSKLILNEQRIYSGNVCCEITHMHNIYEVIMGEEPYRYDTCKDIKTGCLQE